MLVCQNGYVGNAGRKGRGVFARKSLKKGERVEISAFIPIPAKEYRKLSQSVINEYRFEIDGNRCAIALGNVSIYNHSKRPNAETTIDAKNKTIMIEAIRPIKKGKEITIDYGYEVK